MAALNNMGDLLKAKIEVDTDIDWQLGVCANEGGYEVVHFLVRKPKHFIHWHATLAKRMMQFLP